MNTVSNDIKELEKACQAIKEVTLRLSYSADKVGQALSNFLFHRTYS